ncbi:methyl-CpG-binding domain protein 1-like [Sminthopsis crassicaudata]|uniref:methyl-CpG-binding domain protein 1-like n=1 Tax=Sminthopsis crassicaudata TaxID=9301 RepID=UPI003D686FE6
MAEDWLDCPVLGPGWKRRESFRKSGATCGRSDTYYQSPTGERIRSKVELRRFLGPDCDLSRFDFKRGVLQYLPAKGASQKKKEEEEEEEEETSLAQEERTVPQREAVSGVSPQILPASPPGHSGYVSGRPTWFIPPGGSPAQSSSNYAGMGLRGGRGGTLLFKVTSSAGSCENCGASISGDDAQRQRLRTLCRGCRAQRNAFNREQRMFKRVGCGECKACQLTVDCGTCPDCTMRCAQRRCLKIVKKSFGCGVCSGCKVKEDCGTCCICERRGRPELKRQWKCLLRRCLKKRIKKKPEDWPPGSSRADALPVVPAFLSKGFLYYCVGSDFLFGGPSYHAPLPDACPKVCSQGATEPRALQSQRFSWRLLGASRSVKGWLGVATLKEASYGRRGITRGAKKALPSHCSPACLWKGCRPAPAGALAAQVISSLSPAAQHSSSHRQSRKCEVCAACRRCVGCGQCDFCRDKPKFGGCNQKCRWRQCLQFAMVGVAAGCGAVLGRQWRLKVLSQVSAYRNICCLQPGGTALP